MINRDGTRFVDEGSDVRGRTYAKLGKMDEARKSYDLIILDSSPVMKVADALCLSDHADAVLMVVQHRTTSRKAVREALRRVMATRGPLAGIVISKARLAKADTQPYYSGYAA